MPRAIDCPGCGAPLDVGLAQALTRCPYCGQTVDLSAFPRTGKIVIRLDRPEVSSRVRRLTCLIIVFSLIVSFGGAAAGLLASGIGLAVSLPSVSGAALEAIEPLASPPTSIPSFGGEGIGLGLFTDARSIDVDGQGRIYVGDYQGGRIQVFEPDGTFLTQWHARRDLPLSGLGARRDGGLYLVQGGELQEFRGDTGEVRATVTLPGGGFGDVTVTPDGDVLASTYSAGDDSLVLFNQVGDLALRLPMAISSQTGESELDVRVAADGEGNLYGLGTFNETVLVFSPEGRYLDRVGSAGDERGQLRAPASIEVDAQGRIYVGDVDGVEVFQRDGRHLGTIEVDGFPHGMAFAQDGRLLVVNGTRVAWYLPID